MNQVKTYLLVSAGRGPTECCWVVEQLAQKIIATRFSKVNIKVQERQKGPKAGTAYSILLEIQGKEAVRKIQGWLGTIQWIGQSPFRPKHKRKNWFVHVSLLQVEKAERLKLTELEFKTFRASGPGGQHRNKVETAVLVKHRPSGITATASEHRSQHRNKQAALAKLQAQFAQQAIDGQKKIIEQQWKQHLQLERGNPVKIFIGKSFKEK